MFNRVQLKIMFVDGVVSIIVMCGIISFVLSCNNNHNTHCFELVLFCCKFSIHVLHQESFDNPDL
jgi:ribosomal protein L33